MFRHILKVIKGNVKKKKKEEEFQYKVRFSSKGTCQLCWLSLVVSTLDKQGYLTCMWCQPSPNMERQVTCSVQRRSDIINLFQLLRPFNDIPCHRALRNVGSHGSFFSIGAEMPPLPHVSLLEYLTLAYCSLGLSFTTEPSSL